MIKIFKSITDMYKKRRVVDVLFKNNFLKIIT